MQVFFFLLGAIAGECNNRGEGGQEGGRGVGGQQEGVMGRGGNGEGETGMGK